MKVALYARISKTEDRTIENQFLELRAWAKAAGHEIVGEYSDELSSRDLRPKKEELKRQINLGTIKAIAFVSLDRWGRNMSELVLDIEQFVNRGVVVYSMREGLAFDSAAGILQAHILAAFANFERSRIRERTMQGIARARAQGKHLGRPKGSKDKVARNYKKGAEKEGDFSTQQTAGDEPRGFQTENPPIIEPPKSSNEEPQVNE